MLKLSELNKHKYPTTAIIDSNLKTLLDRLNKIRAAWGKPMVVTSGLRSEKQQAELIKAGKSNASKSKHLLGLAADISDPEGELAAWCKENAQLLETIELWCEDPEFTPTWVHFQACPPRSGRRFFKP